jgi:hypothetical protein
LIKTDNEHSISTDSGTWYPQACRVLKIRHYLYSLLEKSLIEEQCSMSKIEPKVLKTISHIKARIP